MSETLIVFLSIGFFALVIAVVAGKIYLIFSLREFRRVLLTLEVFITKMDANVLPVLQEAEQTLRSVRKVGNDVGAVTGSVRDISEASRDIVVNLRTLSNLINIASGGVSTRVSGVGAGLKAALAVVLQQIRERR